MSMCVCIFWALFKVRIPSNKSQKVFPFDWTHSPIMSWPMHSLTDYARQGLATFSFLLWRMNVEFNIFLTKIYYYRSHEKGMFLPPTIDAGTFKSRYRFRDFWAKEIRTEEVEFGHKVFRLPTFRLQCLKRIDKSISPKVRIILSFMVIYRKPVKLDFV